MEQNPINPISPLENRPDLLFNLQPEYTSKEAFDAAYDLSMEDTAVISYQRWSDMTEKEEMGQKLAPEELNKRYPNLPEPFRKPTTLLAAQTISDRHEERARLQSVLAGGPRGLWGGMVSFAGALVPHAIDPLEFGAGLVVGGAAGLIGRGLIGAGGASTTMGRFLLGQGAMNAFGRDVVAGAVGNMAFEPLTIAANEKERIDYTLADSLVGAIGGATASAALGAGLRGLNKGISFLRTKGERSAEVAARTAMAQALTGKKVDISPVLHDLRADVKNTAFPYEFKKITPEELPSTSFHLVDAGGGEVKIIGKDLGPGVYLTDNPNVAHGIGFNRSMGAPLDVHEVKLSELKVLDMDSPLLENDLAALSEAFGESVLKKYQGKGLGLDDILEDIRGTAALGKLDIDMDTAIPKMQEVLQRQGYDALAHTKGDGLPGDMGVQYNSVVLMRPEKIKEISATKKAVSNYAPSMEEVNALRQKTSGIESDWDYKKEDLDKIDNAADVEPVSAELVQKELEEAELEFKELEKSGYATAEDRAQFESLKKKRQEANTTAEAIRAAVHCLRAG